jgi:hypothetical protein
LSPFLKGGIRGFLFLKYGVSKRGGTPLSIKFPLSFILPRKERGIQGVRFKKGGRIV